MNRRDCPSDDLAARWGGMRPISVGDSQLGAQLEVKRVQSRGSHIERSRSKRRSVGGQQDLRDSSHCRVPRRMVRDRISFNANDNLASLQPTKPNEVLWRVPALGKWQ